MQALIRLGFCARQEMCEAYKGKEVAACLGFRSCTHGLAWCVCMQQEMCEAYKGKEVGASVAEVMPLHRKLMLSITNGEQSLELRKLHVRPPPGCPLGDIGRTGVLRHLRAYARGRLLRSVAYMPRV